MRPKPFCARMNRLDANTIVNSRHQSLGNSSSIVLGCRREWAFADRGNFETSEIGRATARLYFVETSRLINPSLSELHKAGKKAAMLQGGRNVDLSTPLDDGHIASQNIEQHRVLVELVLG